MKHTAGSSLNVMPLPPAADAAKLFQEYLAKIVMGSLPVDAWEDYVDEFYSMGGDQIEKMVERCTLEPDELRAPKASWTAERFVLLSKIANLRVQVNGLRMELGREKRKIIEELAYKNPKVTYKDIREAFNAGEEWTFENLPAVKNGDNHEDDSCHPVGSRIGDYEFCVGRPQASRD